MGLRQGLGMGLRHGLEDGLGLRHGLEAWGKRGMAGLEAWGRGMARLEPWEGGVAGNKQWKKGYSVSLEQIPLNKFKSLRFARKFQML